MLQIHNEKLEKYEREMALSDENTKQTYLVNYSNARSYFSCTFF